MIGFVIGILEITAGMSLLILLLLLLLKGIGGKFTAKCRYLIWTLVLFRLAIPFSAGILPALIEIPLPERLVPASEPAELSLPEPEAPAESVPPLSPAPSPESWHSSSHDANPGKAAESVTPVPPTGVSAAAERPGTPEPSIAEPVPSEPAESGSRLSAVLSHLYFTGAAVFLLWNLTAYALYTGKVLRHASPADERTEAVFEAVCRKYGLRRPPILRISAAVQSPIAFGLIRRRIILPELALSDNGLTGTLTHEVTHCRRGDLFVKFLALIARSLHWFNPLSHLAARRCELEMELSCDEAVLDGCDEETRAAYGQVMLDIIRRCRRNRGMLTTHFNPRKNAVKRRLCNILYGSGKKKGAALIALCLLCCLLAGAVISCRYADSNPEKQEEAPTEESEPSGENLPAEPVKTEVWSEESPIYRCDDVYRTNETPTHGTASITLPDALADYTIHGSVLLCDDGCDPTDVLSRAYWGYAPIFRIENYVEFGESDGWTYPARRYDFTPPDDVAEDMREAGFPEYIIYSRKYLYLLTVDESHYAFFEIDAKDKEEAKPDGEEETVDGIVRSAVIGLDTSGAPFPALEYAPPVELDEEAGESVRWVGAYGESIGGAYDGVLWAGEDGEWFAVLGIASHRHSPGDSLGYRTYQVFSEDGMIADARPAFTFTKETVLSSGKPCESLPNGYWRAVYSPDSEGYGLYGCTVYLQEDGRITLLNGIYATDACVVEEGDCSYDPATGRFSAELRTVRSGGMLEEESSSRLLTGSLYRCERFVCFLADGSSSPLPLIFLNDPDSPAEEEAYTYPAEFTGDWYHSYTAEDGTFRFYELELDTENRTIRFADGVFESEYGGRWSGSFTVNPITYQLSAVLHDERNEQPDLTMEMELSYYEGIEEGRVVAVRFLDCNTERYASLIGQTLTFDDEPPVPVYAAAAYDFPAPETYPFCFPVQDIVTGESAGYFVISEEDGSAYYSSRSGRYLTGFGYDGFLVCGRYLIAYTIRYEEPGSFGSVHSWVLDAETGLLLHDFGEFTENPTSGGIAEFIANGAGLFFRLPVKWEMDEVFTEDFTSLGALYYADITADGNLIGCRPAPEGDSEAPARSFVLYSPAGELLRESRAYDEILCIKRGLILVKHGGRMQLLDSSEKLLADFDEWNDSWTMNGAFSGYMASDKVQDKVGETEYCIQNDDGSYSPAEEPEVYPACFWFTIEDRSVPYETPGYVREYLYFPESGERAVLYLPGFDRYAIGE